MPSTVYESLFQELPAVLDIVNELHAAQTSAEIKRKLVQATNAFKSDLSLAKQAANNLQGGELSIEDQESIINTLEELKARKRATLNRFAEEMKKAPQVKDSNLSMEIDSTASTPAA
ncbi:hypothetical protein BDY19DRAFT_1012293 [Irpex rosettiformis]|uniref:Uncharacterized protein n=1 Tax=Irpex rosettiformis TaxID=378272 RepID=A0ACB8U099_9APHY|nr:hypothetical protein BDY19DRAFT_1012293 [Irpex rosettiformis]